jgi:predicted metalloprotease
MLAMVYANSQLLKRIQIMRRFLVLAVSLLVMVGGAFALFAQTTSDSTACPTVQFLAPSTLDDNLTQEYREELTRYVEDVDSYWATTFPALWATPFERPCVIEYEPAQVPYQDVCGLTPEIATQNAFYCQPAHVVMWDGPTFFQPLYVEIGDTTTLYIIAHEYGHAAQFLSEQIPVRSVNRELQADCYAGAYLQFASEYGTLTQEDVQEIVTIIAAVGQSRLTSSPWNRTHGTSLQRELAVRRGYVGGAAACQVDLETLINEGVERPLETLPPGETNIILPNGQSIDVEVSGDSEEITITGPQGNSITLPNPQSLPTPQRPRPGR